MALREGNVLCKTIRPKRYLPHAIDARSLKSAPPGLKTMVNSFHHMRPEDARRILQSAQEANETIFIFELTDNKMPFWGWCLGLVVGLPLVFLFALVLTPWVRPVKWRQLVFTFLVPIVPMFYAWDGHRGTNA